MTRLTETNDGRVFPADQSIHCSVYCTSCTKTECSFINKCLLHLADYEDIGFAPSEIKTAIGIVELLAKTDYPHNFQHEAPWVVEFCKKITRIQEIAKLWRVETIRNHEEDNNGTTD